MRVACIAAGAGGMYCGSCIHDNTLAAALMRLGVDVTLVPTYTPLRTDEESVSLERVFYGGISVYLAQKSALVRRLPPWATRPLDRPGLLRWAAGRFAGSTEARDLGALTLSVLRGEEGRQRRQLEELCRWLARDLRPDLVQLTNTMFAGLAGPLKRALGRPVLCAVQGEEIFLDRLVEPFRALGPRGAAPARRRRGRVPVAERRVRRLHGRVPGRAEGPLPRGAPRPAAGGARPAPGDRAGPRTVPHRLPGPHLPGEGPARGRRRPAPAGRAPGAGGGAPGGGRLARAGGPRLVSRR